MILKRYTTSIHHPVIRITQRPLPKTTRLRPGSAHITQHNIHRPSGIRIQLPPPLLPINRPLNFSLSLKSPILRAECWRWSRPPAIRVLEEAFDFGLDFGAKEVALDGGDAFGGLCRDDVDANNAAGGLGTFDSYLRPAAWRVALFSLAHILLCCRPLAYLTRSTTVCPFLKILYFASIYHHQQSSSMVEMRRTSNSLKAALLLSP